MLWLVLRVCLLLSTEIHMVLESDPPLRGLFVSILDLFPRRVAVVWGLLTVALAAYVVVLTWGPGLTTPEGLVTQVTAQKIIAIVSMSTFVYLSFEVESRQ